MNMYWAAPVRTVFRKLSMKFSSGESTINVHIGIFADIHSAARISRAHMNVLFVIILVYGQISQVVYILCLN